MDIHIRSNDYYCLNKEEKAKPALKGFLTNCTRVLDSYAPTCDYTLINKQPVTEIEMGTRNITAVKINGEYRIAQYGQWDGYPSGQGATVLSFLKSADHDLFKDQCLKIRWADQKDIDLVNQSSNWSAEYPWLSRDAGAEVLKYVYSGQVEFLQDELPYIAESDGFTCEWAYVIDFDTNTLEVFGGYLEPKDDYQERLFNPDSDNPNPLKPNKIYPLDDLPEQDEFEKELDFDPDEVEAA